MINTDTDITHLAHAIYDQIEHDKYEEQALPPGEFREKMLAGIETKIRCSQFALTIDSDARMNIFENMKALEKTQRRLVKLESEHKRLVKELLDRAFAGENV